MPPTTLVPRLAIEAFRALVPASEFTSSPSPAIGFFLSACFSVTGNFPIVDLFLGEPSSCENGPFPAFTGDPYLVAVFQRADSGMLDFLKSCNVAAKSAAETFRS